MALPNTDQVRVVYRAKGVAVPPGDVSAGDKATIDSRLAALEQGQDLGDLNDVDLTGVTGGQVMVYDADTQLWIPSDASPSIAVVDSGSVDLTASTGPIGDGGPVFTIITAVVKYAGAGSAETAARSDHTHNWMRLERSAYAASGTISSGSRTLTTLNLALESGIEYVVEADVRSVQRGSGGSSYYTLSCSIDGNTRTSEQLQCVGGVPDPRTFGHHRSIVGSGGTIPITASIAYDAGDPTDVRAGELVVRAWPRR